MRVRVGVRVRVRVRVLTLTLTLTRCVGLQRSGIRGAPGMPGDGMS